ncbi:FecR domain-containing protein [Planctomicrobium sp. SH661]|uniref:FecR domain-containing protein n=1 Tax=Planctomicrobium sp. SH661 TaxID=3448124 RepID=UPI003F5B9C52
MSTNDRRELDELVNCLLNGEITADQHGRLEQILTSNPQAQDDYFSRIDLHLALQKVARQRPEPDPVADSQLHRHQGSTSSTRRSSWRLAASVVAAGLLLAATMVFPDWLNSPKVPVVVVPAETPELPVNTIAPVDTPITVALAPDEADPPVRLRQSAGAELLREVVPELGAGMKVDHEYVLVKGMIELEFAGGATALLKAPAVFRASSSNRMELKVGSCSVHAPEGAEGFEVGTPRSTVIDLGTRFSVDVNDAGNSDVQVIEGAAQVVMKSEEAMAPKTLTQGEATRVAAPTEGLQAIRFNPHQYQRALPDRIVSYEAKKHGDGPAVRELLSVTAQRGQQLITYPVDELIGIELLHFSSFSNPNSLASDVDLPADVTELLTHDRALNTGVINFDHDPDRPRAAEENWSDYHNKPGLAVRFHEPVTNSPGPDVVLFEVQSVVYPHEGDRFRVSPIEAEAGTRAHLITKFDISLNTANAREVAPFRVFTFKQVPKSLDDLTSGQATARRGAEMSLPFYALAVGIDLSDLGYAEGAKVPGLFFENASQDRNHVLDPVFIGGFPAITKAESE